MTLPFLSMWIIDGGRTQQSAIGGVSSASSSISVRSFGRSRTQTLSSLSTANPVTPPIFHLLGNVLGQSGSNLYLGAVSVCAPRAAARANTQSPHNRANVRRRGSLLIQTSLLSSNLAIDAGAECTSWRGQRQRASGYAD